MKTIIGGISGLIKGWSATTRISLGYMAESEAYN